MTCSGGWAPITVEEYREIIRENGGINKLVVFSCYTELAGQPTSYGTTPREDDVYTEWGRKGDDRPLVYSRRQGTLQEQKWEYGKHVPCEETEI